MNALLDCIFNFQEELNNMGVEIERKFLVENNSWKNEIKEEVSIKQGYLNSEAERTVRVRIYGEKGVLTIR
jgi:adenylate cyclase